MSDRGELVKRWSGFLKPIEAVFRLPKFPRTENRGIGIYALYKGKKRKLYYVGLSRRSLRGRLRAHGRDRHKDKWDEFRFFEIRKVKYVKDIESLILQIANLPGNRVKGRFPKRIRFPR